MYKLPRELQRVIAVRPDEHTEAYVVWYWHDHTLDAVIATTERGLELDHPDADSERADAFSDRLRELNEIFFGEEGDSIEALMRRWQIVMRATAVEVYLKDVLTTLALFAHPSPARESGRSLTFDDLRTASEADSVLQEFCRAWARAFVDDGGPRKWCSRLERLGVARIPKQEVDVLEHMWGVRHTQVHDAGQIGPDFAHRYPDKGPRGAMIHISDEEFASFRRTSAAFVEAVEAGVVSRLKHDMGPAAYSAWDALMRDGVDGIDYSAQTDA